MVLGVGMRAGVTRVNLGDVVDSNGEGAHARQCNKLCTTFQISNQDKITFFGMPLAQNHFLAHWLKPWLAKKLRW